MFLKKLFDITDIAAESLSEDIKSINTIFAINNSFLKYKDYLTADIVRLYNNLNKKFQFRLK